MKLRQLIKEYNLEERVFLLGNKDNIINQLKYIDLVLLCSYIEGLPLVPLEAFSQGVPVIATNIGGTNEEVVNNLNGYIVKIKDINDFCDKILKIYKDDKLYHELRKNSVKVFKEKFNKTLYINKHKNYYSKIQE